MCLLRFPFDALPVFYFCSSFLALFFSETLSVGIATQHSEAVRLEVGGLAGNLAVDYQCLFERSDYSVEYELVPQARLLKMLESGRLDVGIPLVKIDHLDDYAVFTNTIEQVPFHVYSKREIDLAAKDLSGYSFAVVRTASRGGLGSIADTANFKEVTTWLQALELARKGRYHGADILGPVLANLANLAPDKFDELIKQDFGSVSVSTYVSKARKNYETLIEQLNKNIDICLAQKFAHRGLALSPTFLTLFVLR